AARWYAPSGSGTRLTPLSFHLGAGEEILAESPARVRVRHGWRPGTLVLTNSVLAFYAIDWDVEPWCLKIHDLKRVEVADRSAGYGSFVLDVPGRLVIVGPDARDAQFAVADPTWWQSRLAPFRETCRQAMSNVT